jgi:hypothetical protein
MDDYMRNQAEEDRERMQDKMLIMLDCIVSKLQERYENPLEVDLMEEEGESEDEGPNYFPCIWEIVPRRLLGMKIGLASRLVVKLNHYYNHEEIMGELFDSGIDDVVAADLERFALWNKINKVVLTVYEEPAPKKPKEYDPRDHLPPHMRRYLGHM